MNKYNLSNVVVIRDTPRNTLVVNKPSYLDKTIEYMRDCDKEENIDLFDWKNPETYHSIFCRLNEIDFCEVEIRSMKYPNIYSMDFMNERNVFIVKFNEDDIHREVYAHEYFVGLTLNPLIYKIPTFSYMFGFCNYEFRNYPLPIYEYIRDSIDLDKFMEKRSKETVLNVYTQLFFALYIAHEFCGFVHYDLHPRNVLVKTLDSPIQIRYEINGVEYWLKTRYIANVIDYETSTVVLDGVVYTSPGLYYDEYLTPFPLKDIFTLCMFLHWSDRNDFGDILGEFTDEDREEINDAIMKNEGLIPINENENYTHGEFINEVWLKRYELPFLSGEKWNDVDEY